MSVGLVTLGAGLAGAFFGFYLARKVDHVRRGVEPEAVEEDLVFYDVLFFPDSRVVGFDQMCKQEREVVFRDVLSRSPSLQKMKDYLASAEKRLLSSS